MTAIIEGLVPADAVERGHVALDDLDVGDAQIVDARAGGGDGVGVALDADDRPSRPTI